MIRFDFETYTKPFINKDEFKNYYSKKEDYIKKLLNSSQIGWTKPISKEDINYIKEPDILKGSETSESDVNYLKEPETLKE